MTEDHKKMDLVWGAEAIAELIGRTPAQVYHMARAGNLPVKRVGERLVASRAKLIAFFMEDAA